MNGPGSVRSTPGEADHSLPLGLRPHQRVLKRTMDLVGSLVALVLLSPVLLVVALLTWLCHGRPIVYRQLRPGLRGELFRVCKFRTMTNARDGEGQLLPDSQRLTRLGRILRKASLDELPELWNVLRGDMALVGPRPLLPEYLPYYTERERKRHSVRPGITGLAQVSGRNLLCWDDRLELDVQYVERWSLLLDAKIVLKTFTQVVTASGVVAVPRSQQQALHHHRAGNRQPE